MHGRTRTFIEERLLTTQELSLLLGVPMATVQQWVARGKVDCVLKGRTYLFDRNDFLAGEGIPAEDASEDGDETS